MNDDTRMLIQIFLNALAPVLRLFGVIDLTADELAALTTLAVVTVAILGRVIKVGAGRPGPLGAGTVGALAAVGLLVALVASSPAKPAAAAVDCASPNGLTVEIFDTDKDPDALIDHAGAMVKFAPDPLDGIGTRTISDNGDFDDGAILGRVQVAEACAGDYTLTLSFAGGVFTCDVTEATQKANNAEGAALIVYDVNDCAAAPTPTPTATATSTPSPTATATPAPTQTPQPTAIPPTPAAPVIIVIPAPTNTVAPATATPAATAQIRPPNTGSAGLRALTPAVRLEAWGDENDGASLFDSWCPSFW